MKQLFIDKQEVDLYDNTNISLSYKSNIFNDISKIVASNSYTIKLPKTTRNRKILDNACAPSFASKMRYTLHSAKYLLNGIEVIPKATAILLDSDRDYQISLIWGALQNYQDFVNAGETLQNLPNDYYLTWKEQDIEPSPAANNFFYAKYNFIRDSETKKYVFPQTNESDLKWSKFIWYQPVVKVAWILELIKNKWGFDIEIEPEYKEEIQQLVLVLPYRKIYAKVDNINTKITALHNANDSYNNLIYFEGGTAIGNDQYGIVKNEIINGNSFYTQCYEPNFKHECNFIINGSLVLNKDLSPVHDIVVSVSVCKTNGTQITTCIAEKFPAVFQNENYNLSFDFKQTVDVEAGYKYYIVIKTKGLVWNELSDYYFNDISYIALSSDENVAYNEKLYICPNLPEITQINFIKAICQMFCLFALPTENGIKLVHPDKIKTNKNIAVDWTNRLISTNIDEPTTISTKVDDFAQKNNIKYTEDELNETTANGEIVINDLTLEKSKDLLTLPFAASDTDGIPFFEYKKTEKTAADFDDTAEWKEEISKQYKDLAPKPRIMILTNESNLCGISFAGLSWANIIAKYYTYYNSIINHVLVIKISIRLSEAELRDIDYTIPVYLSQYGRFYAIRKIDVSNDLVCVAELIELPYQGKTYEIQPEPIIKNYTLKPYSFLCQIYGGSNTGNKIAASFVLSDNTPTGMQRFNLVKDLENNIFYTENEIKLLNETDYKTAINYTNEYAKTLIQPTDNLTPLDLSVCTKIDLIQCPIGTFINIVTLHITGNVPNTTIETGMAANEATTKTITLEANENTDLNNTLGLSNYYDYSYIKVKIDTSETRTIICYSGSETYTETGTHFEFYLDKTKVAINDTMITINLNFQI